MRHAPSSEIRNSKIQACWKGEDSAFIGPKGHLPRKLQTARCQCGIRRDGIWQQSCRTEEFTFASGNHYSAGDRQRGGGAIYLALRGALLFAFQYKPIWRLLATPLPVDYAHRRRDRGADLRDAATMDRVAAAGDAVASLDRASLPGGQQQWGL
jgi:hypothetical protein